ncbi:MAG: Rid family hydrolase, partial [Anaerolineales bacterium]
MSEHARTVVIPEGGAKPLGPYSPAIRVGNMVFASGTIGMNPDTGSLVEGGVAEETRQALANLSMVLEAGGSSMSKVLKTTVFMTNLQEFATMNEV